MKITLPKRLLAIVVAVALFLSAFNTYLIVGLRMDYAWNVSTFNYVVFQDGNTYKAKSQTNDLADLSSANASIVISQAVAEGDSVYVKSGVYSLTADIEILNKKNARLEGDDATIIGNGYGIVIKGDNYTTSQYNLISGLKITNGSIRIENSFAATISDMTFEECQKALEFANTNTWTEGTEVDNIHFINCTESIAFRTPSENGTGSYASTEMTRCFFNQLDSSVGILVEQNAELSDSQLSNSRFWLGESGKNNQTGLFVDGAMFQTLLSGVVFESFADLPENMYAIAIGENANPAPTLDSVSFLGNWTARVYNPNNLWISGTGSLFQRSEEIPLGTGNQYGETVNVHARPATISSFKLKIQVGGSLAEGERVTVRVRLEFVDNVNSQSVERIFANTTAIWLSDDEMLGLFPSQDVIWAILIDAKTSSSSTRASVNVDMYGITT